MIKKNKTLRKTYLCLSWLGLLSFNMYESGNSLQSSVFCIKDSQCQLLILMLLVSQL